MDRLYLVSVHKVRVCSECTRSRLAQFLKNRVPMAIGMSFSETSVTSRSDIMDRHYLSGQYLKPIKVNTAGLNLSLPTIEIKAIIRTSHRRAPELGEERRYEIW